MWSFALPLRRRTPLVQPWYAAVTPFVMLRMPTDIFPASIFRS